MADIFSNVKQIEQTALLGSLGERTFRFPTFFYRSTSSVAGFLCPLAALRVITERQGYAPLVVKPGYGLLVVSFYEHQLLEDMSPYEEVVMSIPVYRANEWLPPLLPLLMQRPLGSFAHYIFDMPVNSALNRLRGNVLWNLPKTDADIVVNTADRSVSSLAFENRNIRLSLSIDVSGRYQHMRSVTRAVGGLNVAPKTFYNVTQGDFRRANALIPLGRRPTGKIFWEIAGEHPLSGIDPTDLQLFETRFSDNYKSVLYLPGQDWQQ